MSYSNENILPSITKRIFSVWYRHVKVYMGDFYANTIPGFIEPIMFLFGMSLGFSGYVGTVDSVNYTLFLASGMIMIEAMYTAALECSFGTLSRLKYEKVYDGILCASISPTDIVIGELLFAGTKSLCFSLTTLIIVWAIGMIREPLSILAIFAGFIAGVMFAALSMIVASKVKNINNLNFYYVGVLTPMFLFSGIFFPIENLPKVLICIANILPLAPVVRLARAVCIPSLLNFNLVYDLLYCLIFCGIMGFFAVRLLRKRLLE